MYYHLMSWVCVDKAQLFNANQTVEKALNEKKSLLRLGDGEFIIMSGGSIHYQKADEELQKKLANVVNAYIDNPEQCNYSVCMPKQFLECSGLSLSRKRVWVSSWAKTRYMFKKNYDKELTYGDAFLFANGNSEIYSKLWENEQKVVFLHNNKVYAEQFKEKYNVETTFIQVPDRDAFSHYEMLYNKITDTVQDKENTIVLISAGPAAKILVPLLSEKNIWAIDTGHCWDFPLENEV